MRVVLVHHAAAFGPDIDPQRSLSPRGVAQAEWLAGQVKVTGLVPAAIWHSGKLRARQTAEWFWRVCNPMAEFKMVRGLRPEDSPEWMRDVLRAEGRDLLLVSHMPMLPELARTLVPDAAVFPIHGAVVLERLGDRNYVELLRFSPPEA